MLLLMRSFLNRNWKPLVGGISSLNISCWVSLKYLDAVDDGGFTDIRHTNQCNLYRVFCHLAMIRVTELLVGLHRIGRASEHTLLLIS